MVDKFCNYIVKKIRNKMPEIDNERAEVIKYGLELIIGEIPKIFLLFIIGFLLGIGKLTLFAFLIILPYRALTGGFHLKTHLGCIICTNLFYCGNVMLSKYIVFDPIIIKYIAIALIWIFSMMMINIYAPADTENLPILSSKERKIKKRLSYIIATIELVMAIFIPNSVIANIIIFGILLQTLSITRIAYRLTNNKYGYEVYMQN